MDKLRLIRKRKQGAKRWSQNANAKKARLRIQRGENLTRAQHCQCRSGSPDTCPKCTDMETGEKYADQDVAD